ncbi:hypothetical protein L7F22_062557 [Adiantum nelumboides]|nr:hypothetical protein [Adiantum nelumboides]
MFSEIRKAQKCKELCTLKLPFQRLVREICQSFSQGHKQWKVCTLLAFQEASEDFIMEYFNDLTIVVAHAHRVTVMDKDFDTIKHMRSDKLLQPSEFVDKKMRELLVIPPTRKEEADALKIRDITHEVQTRAKATYTKLMDQRQKQINQNRVIREDSEYINETRRINSRNLSLLRSYSDGLYMYLNMSDGERCLALGTIDIESLRNPKAELLDTIVYASIKVLKRLLAAYGSLVGDHSMYDFEIKVVPVKAQTNFVSCGWRCILHSKYILSALFRRKEQFMGKNTIQLYTYNFLSRYRACIISDILEVSQAKTLDNEPMFPHIGDIELMLASGECGVPEEVIIEEREEQRAAGDVQANPMEEMECTREEAEVTVPIIGEDVPAAKPIEINIDAPAVAAKVSSNTVEELKQTMEEPKVEISPKATDNVASNEQANSLEEVRETKEQPDLEIPPVQTHNVASNEPTTSMEEVGTTREEPDLGLPPMIEHTPQDISANQEHLVAGMVAEEPAQSK